MGTTESKEQVNINENFNSSSKEEKFNLGNLILIIVVSTIILTAIILYILKLINDHVKKYICK